MNALSIGDKKRNIAHRKLHTRAIIPQHPVEQNRRILMHVVDAAQYLLDADDFASEVVAAPASSTLDSIQGELGFPARLKELDLAVTSFPSVLDRIDVDAPFPRKGCRGAIP